MSVALEDHSVRGALTLEATICYSNQEFKYRNQRGLRACQLVYFRVSDDVF